MGRLAGPAQVMGRCHLGPVCVEGVHPGPVCADAGREGPRRASPPPAHPSHSCLSAPRFLLLSGPPKRLALVYSLWGSHQDKRGTLCPPAPF